MPMHERRCSPLSDFSRRRPSLSSRQTSRAWTRWLQLSLAMPSSCNAKVQRPRFIQASSSSPKGGLSNPKDSGQGTRAMSPGPASFTSFLLPFKLCIHTCLGVSFSTAPSEAPSNSKLSFGRSVPPSTRTSRRLPSAVRCLPKAQPRHDASSGTSQVSVPNCGAEVCPPAQGPPAGMKVFTTSSSASTPRPNFALPATSGMMWPPAVARINPASITDLGTLPSSSR
mmetsp:Transcript_96200/g.170800  ORF Transcript_96200/g.170800 Transcript_96200/m.170800 type:complete len:226 (-) Transcript_96200:987-1664(-)